MSKQAHRTKVKVDTIDLNYDDTVTELADDCMVGPQVIWGTGVNDGNWRKAKLMPRGGWIWRTRLLAPLHRKQRRHPWLFWVITLVLSILIWLTYSILFRPSDKCDVTADLKPLLLHTHDTLAEYNIEHFADGGTLLGFVRNQGILPAEHDVDLAISEADYWRLVALKPVFDRLGLTLYCRGEYILQKAVYRFWDWSPYLDDHPCCRLYDKALWYYVDLYCCKEVNGSVLRSDYPFFDDKLLNVQPEDRFHCKENNTLGGCQPIGNNLPVQYVEIYGRLMGIPHRTDLTAVYVRCGLHASTAERVQDYILHSQLLVATSRPRPVLIGCSCATVCHHVS